MMRGLSDFNALQSRINADLASKRDLLADTSTLEFALPPTMRPDKRSHEALCLWTQMATLIPSMAGLS